MVPVENVCDGEEFESLWGDARQVGVSEVVAAATTQMARINTIENPTDPA